MGTLRELRSDKKNVHLILSNSDMASMFVYDELKDVCGATLESIVTVNSSSSFKEMLSLVNVEPFLSKKWLFLIEYKSVKSLVEKNKNIFKSESSCFLITVHRYSDYKDVKDLIEGINDLYMSYLRMNEVAYILDGFGMSYKLIEYVAKMYAREADKIFNLRQELMAGNIPSTTKEVIGMLGASSGSVDKLVMLLVSDPPTSERGTRMVFRKRAVMLSDLCETYGVSSVRNYLVFTVKDFIYLKQLYLSGKIYKDVRDLPECFDEKKLSKHNMYLNSIEEKVPITRLLGLYKSLLELGNWRTSGDAISFLYEYYNSLGV